MNAIARSEAEARSVRVPADSVASRRVPRWLWAALAICIVFGVFFRCSDLDRKVVWEDELFGMIHCMGYSEAQIVAEAPRLTDAAGLQKYFRLAEPHRVSQADLAGTVVSLAREDPQHPPAFYVLEHLWVAVFGSSVAAMRALPALVGIIALPFVYLLCVELTASRVAGWLGMAIVAVSPFHLLYAQELREYSLWTVAILALSWTFLRALRLGSVWAWTIFGMTFAAGLYVYPFTGFVAIGAGLYLACMPGRHAGRSFRGYVCAALGALALFSPWLVLTLRADGVRHGLRGVDAILLMHKSAAETLATFIRNVRSAFVDFGMFPLGQEHGKAIYPVATVLIFALIVGSLVVLLRRGNRERWMFPLIALCVPPLALIAHDLIFGGILVIQSRYFTPLYLGLELLVAAAGAAIFNGRGAARIERLTVVMSLAIVFAGGIVSCELISRASTWATKDFEQNRAVAELVNRSGAPVVVSDHSTSRLLGLGFYLDPRVKLELNIHCDNCTLPARPTRGLMAHAAGDVFLLGPSTELTREAAAWAAANPAHAAPRTIDVPTLPDHPTALSMFQPPT